MTRKFMRGGIALILLALLFCLSGALAEGTPALSINDSTSTVSIPASQNWKVTVDAEGMSDARLVWVFADEEEEHVYRLNESMTERERANIWWDEDGIQRTFSPLTATNDNYATNFGGVADGSISVWAEVTYDEVREDTDWDTLTWVRSNKVTVNLTKVGDLPEPVVTGPTEISRGDMVAYHLENADEIIGKAGANIYIVIYDEEYNELAFSDWYEGWDGADTIYLDTSGVHGGTFETYALWWADGYESNGAGPWMTTATEPAEGVSFHINKTDVLTGEQFAFGIFAPNAVRTQYCVEDVGEFDWVDGDSQSNVDWMESGTYNMFARAEYADGSIQESDRVEVRVTSLGTMLEFTFDMPDAITQGSDVTVTLPELDNLKEYVMRLRNNRGEDMVEWWDCQPGTLTLPANFFSEQPESYRLESEARGYGYDSSFCQKYLSVLPENTDERVTLEVNGVSNGVVEVEVHEEYVITLNAQGMTAARVHWGGNDELWLLNEWGEWEEWQQNGSAELSASWGADGEALVYAQVYFGDIDENTDFDSLDWVTSNVVRLSLSANGGLEAPQISMDNTVAWGDYLYVQVENWDTYAENNAWLFAMIRDVENDYEEVFNSDWDRESHWSGGSLLMLPTVRLEPGRAYSVEVAVEAQGWFGESSSADLTVTGERSNQVVMLVDNPDVVAGEAFRFSIYAPGANGVQYHVAGEYEWDMSDGELQEAHDSFDRSGTYQVYAEAYYDDGETCVTSNMVEIRVTSYGSLDQPSISNLPETIQVGESVSFTIDPVEHAEWYRVALVNPENGEELAVWDEDVSAGSFVISGEHFPEGNRQYGIRVHVDAYGYDGNWDECGVIFVLGAQDGSLILTADATEVWANDGSIHFTVDSSDGATLLRLFHQNGWEWQSGPSAQWDIGFNEDNRWPVYAQACYDAAYADINWDEVEIDIDAVQWSDSVSNIVFVNVLSHGLTDVPAITAPAQVTRGEWLTATIQQGGDAEEFDIRIRTMEDEELYFREVFSRGDFLLQTNFLEPGAYKLTVDGVRSGYRWNGGQSCEFEVVEGGDQPYFTIDKTDLQFMERFHLQAHYPNAEAIKIVHMDNMDDQWGYWDGAYAWNDGYWEWFEDQTWGTPTLDAYAMVNGEWVKFGSVTLNVAAPIQLETPELNLRRTQYVGDTLSVHIVGEERADAVWMQIEDTEGNVLYWMEADGNDIIITTEDWSFSETGEYVVVAGAFERQDAYDRSEANSVRIRVVDPQNLSTLKLPNGLAEIDDEAFENTDVQFVQIPSGTTRIGSRAFANCENLAVVEIPSSVTDIADDAFAGSDYVNIRCSEGSYAERYGYEHNIGMEWME